MIPEISKLGLSLPEGFGLNGVSPTLTWLARVGDTKLMRERNKRPRRALGGLTLYTEGCRVDQPTICLSCRVSDPPWLSDWGVKGRRWCDRKEGM